MQRVGARSQKSNHCTFELAGRRITRGKNCVHLTARHPVVVSEDLPVAVKELDRRISNGIGNSEVGERRACTPEENGNVIVFVTFNDGHR